MQINRIELDNVKSYERATVDLQEGVNAIYGRNGAGKSTLLEAVGFALFHTLPYNQEDFVKKGESKARVALFFESARDGVEYMVEREIGSSSICRVYGPAGGRPLTEGVGETAAWLKDHLGVAENVELKTLFEEAVGVEQGKLTAAFLLNDSPRRDVFDPLLRVDEYDDAWDNLGAVERHCKRRVEELARNIDEYSTERLASLRNQQEDLVTKIETARQHASNAETELANLESERTALADVQSDVERLKRAVEGTETNIRGLNRQHKRAERDLRKAREANKIVQETRAGHQAYETAVSEEEPLEEERKARNVLRSELEQSRLEASQIQSRAEQLDKRLRGIEIAQQEMELLASDVATQNMLDREVAELEEALRRLENAHNRYDEEQKKLEELQAKLESRTADFEQRKKLSGQIAALDDQIEALTVENNNLKATLATLDNRHKQFEHRIEALESAEEAMCPVCREPLSVERAKALLEEYCDTAVAIKGERASIEETLASKHNRRNALGDERARLAAARDNLATARELDDLREEIQLQRSVTKQWNNELTRYQDVPTRLEERQKALAELGNPRGEYSLLEAKAADAEDVRAACEKAQLALDEAERTVVELEVALSEYNELDQALHRIRQTKLKYGNDYRRHLMHKAEADALGERQEEVEQITEELDKEQEQLAALQSALQEVQSGYDSDRHRQVNKEYERLRAEKAVLADRLHRNKEQLLQVEDSIQKLEEELTDLETKKQKATTTHEAAAYVRQAIRDAGPEMASILVQGISQEADEIFKAIMNDYTLSLSWDTDYGITVEQSGHERIFKQLSGGEQMAAAMAVRLAFLKRMSDIDVAFFDEPTTNLDDERRDGLAEQVTNIQGFSQLFVISHDDAFERTAGHVVYLEKERGISRVLKE